MISSVINQLDNHITNCDLMNHRSFFLSTAFRLNLNVFRIWYTLVQIFTNQSSLTCSNPRDGSKGELWRVGWFDINLACMTVRLLDGYRWISENSPYSPEEKPKLKLAVSYAWLYSILIHFETKIL